VVSREIFNKQLSKGRIGESWFLDMAKEHWDEVYDYTNFALWEQTQKSGIDFGFKNREWSSEIYTDVKSNLYYNQYKNDWEFGIEYSKWSSLHKKYHGREEEKGWIQDSKSNRIYHTEVLGSKEDGYFSEGRYVYYDLDEMRSFIYREWDRPKNNWIQSLSYIGTKWSDYSCIIPVRMSDERFNKCIKKWEI
jgi:hypothetical protein